MGSVTLRHFVVFGFLCSVLAILAGGDAVAQSPSEIIPNDPQLDVSQARVTNVLAAYADILRIEQTSQPKMQQAVIAMLDDWVDCTHVELQAACLSQLAFNATDRPYQNSETHGTSAAGTGMAETNNAKGVASTGGFSSRVKFIPIKVCDGNNCRPDWVKAGLQRVLELKRSGIPIVVVGCNFLSGVTDPVGMDQLLKDLDSEQIDLIAASPNNPLDLEELDGFAWAYSRKYPNIISVTAGNETAQGLTQASSFGAKTVSLTAVGVNVKTVSTLNPVNGSASFSGSSSVTEQVAAAYALVRVYREPNSSKAREILKFTARMYPGLEGKLKATRGDSGDAGRMAGKIDVHDALTLPFGCPAPNNDILLVNRRDSSELVFVDTVSFRRGPLRASSPENLLTPDKQTRIALFAYNISLLPAETLDSIKVRATDSSGTTVPLVVEFEGKLPAPLGCISQLNVNLKPPAPHPALAPGSVTIRVEFHGRESSGSVISLLPSN